MQGVVAMDGRSNNEGSHKEDKEAMVKGTRRRDEEGVTRGSGKDKSLQQRQQHERDFSSMINLPHACSPDEDLLCRGLDGA